MICPHCGGNIIYPNEDGDPQCLCGYISYSEIFDDKKREYPPEVKQLAVTLKPGRSLSQVQVIIGELYGKKPTREIIRRWCNGNGKRKCPLKHP